MRAFLVCNEACELSYGHKSCRPFVRFIALIANLLATQLTQRSVRWPQKVP